MRRRDPRRRLRPLCFALSLAAAVTLSAREPVGSPRFFTDDCHESAIAWTATAPNDLAAAVVGHEPTEGAAAPGCAQAVWRTAPADVVLRFDRPVPPAAALEELTASLAAFTPNRCAAGLRVIFPNAIDPATGEPANAWIAGDLVPATGTFAWRTLTVGTDANRLNDARRRVRLALGPDPALGDAAADLSGAVVDRVGVLLWTDGGADGRAGVRVDDVRLGPLVAPAGGSAGGPAGGVARLDPLPEPTRRASVDGGRMTVDGDPFFPRLTFDHGVDPDLLAGSGFNLVQVLDWRDREALARIAASGMGAVAQPPSPGEAGAGPADLNAPADAGLAPFGPATDPIWLWNLGPRIPGDAAWVAATGAWVDAVRGADVARDRPVLLGVTGSERAYSRITDLLGVSRMVCGTALPLWEHTALLREAADRKARPGEPLFTWIQTAPHGRTAAMRAAAGLDPAALEPELISRQTLGAIAGGVKGVGYWTSEPLDDSTPARTERRLALTLTNLQLAAVEPILAAATKVAPLRVVPATTGDPAAANRIRGGFGNDLTTLGGDAVGGAGSRGVGVGGARGFGSGFGGLGARGRTARAAEKSGASSARPPGRCTGALLNHGADRLVVAVWHGNDDQFVPGPAPFTSASFTIPGALPTARAWRITPTSVRLLKHEQVTGGMKIVVPDFGDGAVVLVTPDHGGAKLLDRRVARQAPAAAAAAVELARLKLERTRATDAKLRGGVADGRWLDAHLRSADAELRKAERKLANRDWDGARIDAEMCRRFARAVQRTHWDRLAAEARLAGQANGSPHLIAFSTLPDHVDLVRRLAAAERGAPVALLDPAGPDRTAALPPRPGSDRGETVRRNGRPGFAGRVYYGAPPSVAAAATLTDGELRLTARPKPGYDRPSLLDRGLVVLETAPVDVPAGHAAVIRGQVRLDGPIVGNGEGVTVHDSWSEELGGLRWTGEEPAFRDGNAGGWASFELIRPLPPAPGRTPRANPDGSRPITATVGLHGLGSARFRGVTVETVALDDAPAPVEDVAPPPAPAPRFLERLGGALRRR